MKVLIAGDSFAADWSSVTANVGWVNLLEKDFQVTNIARAGISEYKIYKQLISQNLSRYDKVVVSHTSPYRIPIQDHPIHKESKLHWDCDLIYSDVVAHKGNTVMNIAKDFYENVYYLEYFEFTHNLIVEKIFKLSSNIIHITFFDYYTDPNINNLFSIFKEHKGKTNHLSKVGNRIAYSSVKFLLT